MKPFSLLREYLGLSMIFADLLSILGLLLLIFKFGLSPATAYDIPIDTVAAFSDATSKTMK